MRTLTTDEYDALMRELDALRAHAMPRARVTGFEVTGKVARVMCVLEAHGDDYPDDGEPRDGWSLMPWTGGVAVIEHMDTVDVAAAYARACELAGEP